MARAVQHLQSSPMVSVATEPPRPTGPYSSKLSSALLFTLAALVLYRLGTFIPLPGIHHVGFGKALVSNSTGIIIGLDVLAGGAIQRMGIFALSIFPYVSALVIIELMAFILPKLRKLKNEGEKGRQQFNQYARFLTLIVAALQAYGISIGLEGLVSQAGPVVVEPGTAFRISTVATLVCGTALLMWLAEQITRRGIGDGFSLIVFAGIAAALPSSLATLFDLTRTGTLLPYQHIIVLNVMLIVVLAVVVIERARRNLLIQYPTRERPQLHGGTSTLSLRLNTGNPFASVFAFILTVQAGNMLLYSLLILFVSVAASRGGINAREAASALMKDGAFLPGIRPGQKTAEYVEYVNLRISVVGAVFLTIVCTMSIFMVTHMPVPIGISGIALATVSIIAVNTLQEVRRVAGGLPP